MCRNKTFFHLYINIYLIFYIDMLSQSSESRKELFIKWAPLQKILIGTALSPNLLLTSLAINFNLFCVYLSKSSGVKASACDSKSGLDKNTKFWVFIDKNVLHCTQSNHFCIQRTFLSQKNFGKNSNFWKVRPLKSTSDMSTPFKNLQQLGTSVSLFDEKFNTCISNSIEELIRGLFVLIKPLFRLWISLWSATFSHVSHKSPRSPAKPEQWALTFNTFAS